MQLINGVWTEADAASSLTIANPATLKPLARVANCDAGDIARAVTAARQALPAWRAQRADDRAALLGAIGERVRARRREIASILSRESGKPVCEASDCVEGAARVFVRAASREAVSEIGAEMQAGVVAALASYHFPLLGLALTTAPAIAAGHTAVFRAAPQAPLASLELARACDVLPAGVLNVVTGGEESGRMLVTHTEVAHVRFSGTLEESRRVADQARGKRVDLLARARSAFIVCADADLERTVPSVAWQRLNNAGQSCGSAQHLYVERSIAAEFAERLHQCIGFLDVDDPAKLPTDIGPLISLDAANKVEDQVGRTLRSGAMLVLGGRRFRPSGLAGHFFQPTLLIGVKPGSVPAVEEILGPVVTITPVAGLAQALRLTMESGCRGACIYSADVARARDALESVGGGNFRINDPQERLADRAPLALPAGMREMIRSEADDDRSAGAGARAKHVAAADSIAVEPWWFPYLERNKRASK